VAAADVRVRPDGAGNLCCEAAGRGLSTAWLDVFPSDVQRLCFALAAGLLGHGHGPRLRRGALVIKRRSWDLSSGEWPAPVEGESAFDEFLRWRRWATGQGMPRHVFARVAGEPKPQLVDFSHAASVALLAHQAREGASLRVSEMRPGPDALWLRDERGRYCCELRMTMLPLESPARASTPRPSGAVTPTVPVPLAEGASR
jgi:hypothetical protein